MHSLQPHTAEAQQPEGEAGKDAVQDGRWAVDITLYHEMVWLKQE
jgi:hypothetical protein